MKRGLVVGMANAGKTLFCTKFAEFLGARDLQWVVERTDGRTEQRRVSLTRCDDWGQRLAGPTRFLQSICLDVPFRGRSRHLLLTDSAGLAERGQQAGEERASVAQTLSMLMEADIVVHVLDAHFVGSRVGDGVRATFSAVHAVDSLVTQVAGRRSDYLILANKMDLPSAKAGYRFLCKQFSKQRVFPVSALYGTGLREVKQHVWRLA